MIFPFERVPVPDMGGYVKTQGKRRYYFVYVGERLLNEKTGNTTHPKAKCIGRLEPCEQGDELMPNEFYYELMGLSEPGVAVKEGVGRKPYHQKALPINIYDKTLSKVAETAETEEREDGSYSFQSVIISVLQLKSDKTQLSKELKKVEKERDDWKNVCKYIFKGLGMRFSETAERCREIFDFYKSKFKQFFNKEAPNSSSFENRLAKEMGYPSEDEEEEKSKNQMKFHHL